MNECKPLPDTSPGLLLCHATVPSEMNTMPLGNAHAENQGLTLVHFSAQCKCFLWDRGYI